MRDISFRAWNNILKKFEFLHIIHKHSILTSCAIPSRGTWESLEPFQQYIGLPDKNGKHIYEGDFVKALTDGEEDVFEIKWLEEKEWSGWEIGRSTECEVIGNIYENPNLVK